MYNKSSPKSLTKYRNTRKAETGIWIHYRAVAGQSVGNETAKWYIFDRMRKVAVGILSRDGKILVCQRKRGSRYALEWEFPGGKLEPGESVLDCLQRELREELSLSIDGADRTEIQSSYYDDGGEFEVAYCFVSKFSGEPKNNVFEEIRWIRIAELDTLDILEGNKPFVARLREAG